MRFSRVVGEIWPRCGWDLADWLERLTIKAVVATVLGSIPASSDTVKLGAADETVLNTVHKKPKISPFKKFEKKELPTQR
jgi:hypothetical protein